MQRRRGLDAAVRWNAAPPRLRLEEAVVDVAAGARSDLDAVAELARVVGSRRTTAARLLETLDARARVPRRAWLAAVVDDIAQGTCSVLEHGYLTRVERAHGLGAARRQVRDRLAGRHVYRDLEYDGLVVELDGVLWHDTPRQRDRDLERDLMSARPGRLTVRLGWGQVFDRPCLTAAYVSRLLPGAPGRRCGEACAWPTSG